MMARDNSWTDRGWCRWNPNGERKASVIGGLNHSGVPLHEVAAGVSHGRTGAGGWLSPTLGTNHEGGV